MDNSDKATGGSDNATGGSDKVFIDNAKERIREVKEGFAMGDEDKLAKSIRNEERELKKQAGIKDKFKNQVLPNVRPEIDRRLKRNFENQRMGEEDRLATDIRTIQEAADNMVLDEHDAIMQNFQDRAANKPYTDEEIYFNNIAIKEHLEEAIKENKDLSSSFKRRIRKHINTVLTDNINAASRRLDENAAYSAYNSQRKLLKKGLIFLQKMAKETDTLEEQHHANALQNKNFVERTLRNQNLPASLREELHTYLHTKLMPSLTKALNAVQEKTRRGHIIKEIDEERRAVAQNILDRFTKGEITIKQFDEELAALRELLTGNIQ